MTTFTENWQLDIDTLSQENEEFYEDIDSCSIQYYCMTHHQFLNIATNTHCDYKHKDNDKGKCELYPQWRCDTKTTDKEHCYIIQDNHLGFNPTIWKPLPRKEQWISCKLPYNIK